MTEELLKQIAQKAKADQIVDAFDPRWERYAAGELSDRECSELFKSTASDQLGQFKIAFAPIDNSFHSDIVDRLAEIDENQSDSSKQSNVTELPLRNSRRKPWLPLSLAASFLLAIGAFQLSNMNSESNSLPNYQLASSGGAVFRSDKEPESIPQLKQEDRLSFRLTPDTSTVEQPSVLVYAQLADATIELDQLSIEVAATGAARIEGRVGETIPNDQRITRLLIVLGQAEHLPDGQLLARELEGQTAVTTNRWQGWAVSVQMQGTR